MERRKIQYLDYAHPTKKPRDLRGLCQIFAIGFTIFYLVFWPIREYGGRPPPAWQLFLWEDAPVLCAAILGTINLLASLRRPRDVFYITFAILNAVVNALVVIAIWNRDRNG